METKLKQWFKYIYKKTEPWVKFLTDDISIVFFILLIVFCLVFIEKINPSSEVVGVVIGIIASVIGIALPIVIGDVSNKLVPYNSKVIANSFKHEPCYVLMFLLLPICAVSVVLYMFFNLNKEGLERAIELITVCGTIFSIYVFYRFIKRAIEYSINTDDVVFQICKKHIEKAVYNRNTYEKYLEDLDLCSCIIQKKIKSDNPNNLGEISKLTSNVIMDMFAELKFDKANELPAFNKVSEKYYSIVFNSWFNSYNLYPDVANMLLKDYEIVVMKAIKSKKQNISFDPLFFLYQRVANEITNEEFRKLPYLQTVPCQWYFNIVFDDAFDMNFLEKANMYMFTIMKNIIDGNRRNIFEPFIGRCVDSLLYVPPYSYPDSNDNTTYELLLRIQMETDFAYTSDSFEYINDLIKKLDIGTDDRGLIHQLVAKQYKYNKLQFLVAIIASYCYFKNYTDYVKYILFYNQPHNSTTIFINHDIVPDNLMTIILWYLDSNKILFNYNILWGDHHDAKTWFYKCIALMACRISEKGEALYPSHYEVLLKSLNKQQCDAVGFAIDDMVVEIEAIKNVKGFGLDNSIKDKVKGQLNTIKKEVERIKEGIMENQEIDKDKEEGFKKNIVDMVLKNSNWKGALSACTFNGDGIEEQLDLSSEQILEKSFMAKDDRGLYIGIEHTFASRIINQIDWKVEIKLRAFSKLSNKYVVIRKEDFKQQILNLSKDDVVVFINYFGAYDFLLNDKGFQWENDGYIVGITSKGTTIMSFADNRIKTSRLFVFDKTEWTPLKISFINGNINVTDLNKADCLRNEILGEKTQCVQQYQSEEELERYLKKCVHIEIRGNVTYTHVKQPKVTFIDNLKD